jgi:TolB-like protein
LVTRSEFESAVKDALRHYTQADLLAGNALLHARLITGSTAGAATPKVLRALLAETAKTLFAGERDQRLYRILDLTYLNPAPKQEAAADRLGLSFSTYRRHLTASVDRLIEWLWQQEQEAPESETASGEASATEETDAPVQRPRLSIVILPFLNLSQDPSVDYLVDGVVDSLITDLSRALPGSFVISRSTAFTYKGRQAAIRQVGEELGVRYVLEGSVRVEPDRVRVNVQLIDALTDEHLWAERFDKERKDIREVQDEIVARLSRSVGIEMVRTEAERGSASNSGEVVDLVMRARAQSNDIKRRENAARAVELFRQGSRSRSRQRRRSGGHCSSVQLPGGEPVPARRTGCAAQRGRGFSLSRHGAGSRSCWRAEGARVSSPSARPVRRRCNRHRDSYCP